tara:strand:- start:4472 stop:5614 length:1143 start_codon:yes stop_codon:yes gene_type:complete
MPHQEGHSFQDMLGNFFGSPTAGLIGAIGQNVLTNRGIDDIDQMRRTALTGLSGEPNLPNYEGGLLGEVERQSQFRPFTVTSTNVFGQPSAATISREGTELALSPEEANVQRALTGFGQGAFDFLNDPAAREQEQSALIGMLTQDPGQRAGREADIFARLEAAQEPARERARLQLEERLLGQGRTGVRTAAYGGTPEQLALNQAIEEQRARSAISAMEQARAEQALQSGQTLQGLQEFRGRMGLLGQLGLSAIPTAFVPQQELLRTLTPQLQATRLATDLERTGLGLGAALGEAGLEAELGFAGLQNALRQQQYQGLFDLLRSERDAQSQPQPTTLRGGFGEAMGMIQDALKNQAEAAARQVFNPQGTPVTMRDGSIVYL